MKVRLRRVGLVAAMGLVSLNIWTGAPLFAVWVGSRMQQDSNQPTMGSVAVVVLVLATVCFTLVRVLAMLSARYDAVVGRAPQGRRQQSPWLRSLRGERAHPTLEERPLQAIEYVLVAGVVLCAAVFEVWFFFFSGSPLGPA
jgi:thiosulfate reductase cytochrome b subunit